MLIDGTYAISDEQSGFPARLRQVLDSYGTGIALAQAIGRSEGALRKWLRGVSEPKVSDIRAICKATNTNVEWLVLGRGEQKCVEVREPCSYRYTPRRAASCSHHLDPYVTLREAPSATVGRRETQPPARRSGLTVTLGHRQKIEAPVGPPNCGRAINKRISS